MTQYRESYERLREWYRSNLEILQRLPVGSIYREHSRRAIEALPEPAQATDADLKWVVHHVLSQLLEWGNNYRDDAGGRMRDYAHQIEAALRGSSARMEDSPLQKIFLEYNQALSQSTPANR